MPHINKTPQKNPDLKIINPNSYQTTNVKIIKKKINLTLPNQHRKTHMKKDKKSNMCKNYDSSKIKPETLRCFSSKE